jgi:membrane fusion protein, multidrug efflux system
MPSKYPETKVDRLSGAAQRMLPQPVARFVTRRMIVMLLCVLAVLVVVFGYIIGKGLFIASMMKSMVQTTVVSTTTVTRSVWQTELSAVGSLHAVQGADLAAVGSGVVAEINFNAGQDVKKGAVLVQLRVDSERASAEQAMRTYKRDLELIKTNAVSRTDFDTALANMKTTKAAVDDKTVRAPFSGRIGIRQVDLGAYVAAGTTMVTLQQLDPIYVDFKAPQQQLPLLKVGSRVDVVTDTFPGKVFRGVVSAINPKVDDTTRTVQVRATILNPGKQLLPGMFATVSVDTGRPQNLLTLPQTAITYNTYGNSVFVAKKVMTNGKPQFVAEQRTVATGDTRGDQVAILSGLKMGEVVVSSGSNKLKNGTVLSIDNTTKLPNDASPTPSEETE